jgi:amino acid transporter
MRLRCLGPNSSWRRAPHCARSGAGACEPSGVGRQLERAVDVRGAIAINVITMIGIGPLITIPLVLAQLAGPLALIGWVAGALVALCDGLVWSELATRYPGSGGTYVYLREVFGRERWGRLFAFLYNWQFFLSSSLTVATGYIGFAMYSGYVAKRVASSPELTHGVAIGVGVVTILLLYRRVGSAAHFGVALAAVAVATLLLVGIAGFSHADFQRAFSLTSPVHFGWAFFAGFGSALYITLYDYAGYSQVAFLGEEVLEPRRTLPISIVGAVLIVLALYLFVQVGVLGALPWQSLVGHNAQPVASAVVAAAWGKAGADAVTVLILITAFASVYGGLLGNSRVPFAAARDGEFLPVFARLHPTGHFPYVSLLGMGAISLVACFFDLGTVIAILSSAGILVGSIGQIIALFVLRARGETMPFRMWLFPLPALVALAGWILAFWYTGAIAIGIGIAWLVAGAVVFLVLAHAKRWWPFVATATLALLLPRAAYAEPVGAWATWHTSRIVQMNGYPVFEVDRKPFFLWGASFFYERIPRGEWLTWLRAYRDALHLNTIDVYVPWNWQEPRPGELDFTGRTNPRRDLLGLFGIIHSLGLKVVLRPGPVIRNEWRNGGYPSWLLERPAYDMPLHDVLEGRYPATATLQNRHANAAADEWLHNATHLHYSGEWLRDVLTAIAPYSHDVIAIALDDDQGAYLDNDTWPAPHWHAYIDWLESVVHSVTGSGVPVFINTWQMKVAASSPAWAWGNWYQSNAYAIGEHDREQLDFSTDLIGTQPAKPIMISEFQAGWLQGADEGVPRPADPTNTALALSEMLADGAHGIVNFPVQDTIYPAGWEVPWANWAYDWDAAFTACFVDCDRTSARFVPTAAFGDLAQHFGEELAISHRLVDAHVVWPPSLFPWQTQTAHAVAQEADATIAMLHDCHDRGLACSLTDLRYGRIPRGPLILPIVVTNPQALLPTMRALLNRLRAGGRLVSTLADVHGRVRGDHGEATLLCTPRDRRCLLNLSNWSASSRTVGPYRIVLGTRTIAVPQQTIGARSSMLFPVPAVPTAIPTRRRSTISCEALCWDAVTYGDFFPFGTALLGMGRKLGHLSAFRVDAFDDGYGSIVINDTHVDAVIVPDAGARIASGIFASTIGLLRDAVDPEPPWSPRDYIAASTHPMPAGTFNRPYRCAIESAGAPAAEVTCSYDAPDLPEGGARFERTLSLAQGAREIVIHERMTPHDRASTARLKSISGFAIAQNDVILAPTPGGSCFGVYAPERQQLARLCWRPDELAFVNVRPTRGAVIVTLHFRRDDVEMRLGVFPAATETQAQTLLSL